MVSVKLSKPETYTETLNFPASSCEQSLFTPASLLHRIPLVPDLSFWDVQGKSCEKEKGGMWFYLCIIHDPGPMGPVTAKKWTFPTGSENPTGLLKPVTRHQAFLALSYTWWQLWDRKNHPTWDNTVGKAGVTLEPVFPHLSRNSLPYLHSPILQPTLDFYCWAGCHGNSLRRGKVMLQGSI